jgi:hypothetical protein
VSNRGANATKAIPAEKWQRILRALEAEPDLSSPALQERFGIGQGTINKARAVAGIQSFNRALRRGPT